MLTPDLFPDLDIRDGLSREDIITLLQQRIEQLLAGNFMEFIQLMYRLDIPEDRLKAALDTTHAAQNLANIIWDRQILKAKLRAAHNQPQTDTRDDDLRI